jgi:hypothetical protein
VATQAYYNWVKAGRPWNVAQPIADLVKAVRAHGYESGSIGDESHLQAATPEDHCPFSATGWPLPNPYPWLHACDIMPPSRPGTPSLVVLGKWLFDRKQAGDPRLAWLKYMNWTDAAGACWHDSWKPGHVRVSSTDRGHIHLSGRTDYTHSTVAAGLDPVAEIMGSTAPARGDDDMPLEGMDRAQVNNSERYLQAMAGLVDHAVGISDTVNSKDLPVPFVAAFRQLVADVAELKARPAATVALAPADLDALAAAVAGKVGHAPTAAEVAKAVNDDEAARLAS